MERYIAINFNELFDMEDIEKQEISFWLLYKTKKTQYTAHPKFPLKTYQYTIRFANASGEFMDIRKVDPETLCYLVYKNGEGYKKVSLLEEAESKVIDFDQIFLKEGVEGRLLEKWERDDDPLNLISLAPSKIISEMYLHETNGFCVFSPRMNEITGIRYRVHTSDGWSKQYGDEKKVKWYREVLICYNSNKKRLHKAYLKEICCRVLDTKDFEYKQFFIDTLLDEQMCLSQMESLELYFFIEKNFGYENITKYYIHGNEEVKNKEVLFVRRAGGLELELFFDAKKMKVKGYGADRLYEWWINGQLENIRLKSAMMGILE